MLELEPVKIERLRAVVAERLGLAYDGDRLEQLIDAVQERITVTKASGFDQYFARLCASGPRDDELVLLAERLTVTETYFLRNSEQIAAFVDVVARDPTRAPGRRLRVLSAGCASGEEPYSLAMALIESLPRADGWDIEISAVDVNRAMLARAKHGSYSAWSLRATPDATKARFFRQAGREFVLEPEVRRLVTFEEQNLAHGDRRWLGKNHFDAIFCRNVLMYFTPPTMRRVVAELREALVPSGHLFLGHAETLRGVSHGYRLRHSHATFYYQRREDTEREPVVRPAELDWLASDVLPAAAEESGSWFEAIELASERIRRLAERRVSSPRPDPARQSSPAAAASAPTLTPIFELVARERYADALDALGGLSDVARADPDALLLRAILLTNHGRVAEAEAVCGELLDRDELNAGAHYVTALCREHAADPARALEHDRMAMHLDAGFAMPHLHAGLLSKRLGELDLARHWLGEALDLVEREDASRLLLFGGGFSRQALARVCRVELELLGGGA